jgi:hypothetical protein
MVLLLERLPKRRCGDGTIHIFAEFEIWDTNLAQPMICQYTFYKDFSKNFLQAQFDAHVVELVAQIKDLLEENETLSTAWSDVEEQRREHLAALEMMQVKCDDSVAPLLCRLRCTVPSVPLIRSTCSGAERGGGAVVQDSE